MLTANRVAPLALALLLVLAGCGATPGDEPVTTDSTTTAESEPASTDSPATTALEPEQSVESSAVKANVTVENGTLPVDANRTFGRVQSLVGEDVDPRPVEVRNLSEWRRSLPRIASAPINDALGFENVSANWSEPSGVTKITGYVYIHPGEGSTGAVERVLAHEFAHSIQYQATMLPWLDQLRTGQLTTDEAKTLRSLQEGGAVYVADVYTHRYLDVRNDSAVAREYMSNSPTHWSVLAPYYFGNRYVDARIDSPANLSTVYENRPNTTEQLIHNETPAQEPPASLSVDHNVSQQGWQYVGTNRLGEMTTRGALGTELNESRAATAAAGWGTDELAIFQHGTTADRNGWVWIHRWDDPDEATEAHTALRTYADRRTDDSEYEFTVTRISNETTGIVFGDGGFVANTTVDGTAANVSISVGS